MNGETVQKEYNQTKNAIKDSYISRLFGGRITRVNYLFGALGFQLVVILGTGLGSGALAALISFTGANLDGLESIILLAVFPIWIAMIFYGASFTVRRFHDLDKSAYYLLWLLVPLVNLYFYIILFFMAGKEQANNYGVAPVRKLNIRNLLGFPQK